MSKPTEDETQHSFCRRRVGESAQMDLAICRMNRQSIAAVKCYRPREHYLPHYTRNYTRRISFQSILLSPGIIMPSHTPLLDLPRRYHQSRRCCHSPPSIAPPSSPLPSSFLPRNLASFHYSPSDHFPVFLPAQAWKAAPTVGFPAIRFLYLTLRNASNLIDEASQVVVTLSSRNAQVCQHPRCF